MCGIAGIMRVGAIVSPEVAIPERWLDVLDGTIRRRGPDGHGRWRTRAPGPDGKVAHVALVHRRLSILDEAGGAQPMVLPGGAGSPETAVVFNGCIYNHRELRARLIEHGHEFRSDHSDTETLLHGHRRWGRTMHERLDGMYAAAIWDGEAAELILLRDLMGEKPLYFVEIGADRSLVAFASMVPGLLALLETLRAESEREGLEGISTPDIDACLELDAASLTGEWLRLGWGHGTPWRGIRELKPGQLAWFDAQGRTGRRRLSIDAQVARALPLDAESTRFTIERAVRSRLEADVPLGCFLSGGLDSGLIAAFAQQSLASRGERLRTFTMRMPDPRYDESEAAAETARTLGTDHTTLDVDPDPATDLPGLIEFLGLPFSDSSLLPTSWLSRAARTHVKVALAGDGGDELFGGYDRHAAALALRRARRTLRLLSLIPWSQSDPKSRTGKVARLARAAGGAGYADLLSIFDTHDLARLLGTGRASTQIDTPSNPLAHDRDTYLPFNLLRKTDTASMIHALEVRAPLLEPELVARAGATPLSALMPRGRRKGMLRDAAKGMLPDAILARPKSGFAIPVGDWLRPGGPLRGVLSDTVLDRSSFDGLPIRLDHARIETLLREHDGAGAGAGRDHAQRLYLLLVLGLWNRWRRAIRGGLPAD